MCDKLEDKQATVPNGIVLCSDDNAVVVDAGDEIALAGGNNRLAVQNNLKLDFYDVSYSLKQRDGKSLQILKDTCGSFKSGRLAAILGSSGAGKTSMLNVLTGFKANGVTGQFELNGQKRQLASFRKICSYIPQDFVMLDLLTVFETLKVSADLKLPIETSALNKQKIIDDILNALNMQKCRQTLVGNLSGGERKRLSIGVELITNPPIMFFDEPTSGLDSVASLQVINHLQHLACGGRIIVCVVHQPSSRLMKLFDDVLIMSRGEVLYDGAQSEMLDFFKQSGYECPNYYNPADFVLEVSSEEHNEKIEELVQRTKLEHRKNVLHTLSVDEKTELLMHDNNSTSMQIEPISVISDYKVDIRPKECVPFWTQFSVLTQRHSLAMSRNLLAVQLRLIMHVIVGALIGIVYWQIGNDASKALSNSSCLLFIVLFLFFGNANPSILLCQQDPFVFIREYLNGWYSVKAYYLSKLLADLPMQIFCPSVFIAIAYYMTGQPLEWHRFLMCWSISIMTTIIGHFVGLISGSLFDLNLSMFLVPAITIPFVLFSGFFIRLSELSWFLRPICDVSYFRYFLEGLMRALYGYEREALHCSKALCYYKSPQKFLKDFDMFGDEFEVDLIALSVFVVLLMVLFYVSLIIRIRRAL